MASDMKDRISGVLLGLAAGDKNGGPQRLALLLAHSVFTAQKFDIDAVWNSYVKWYEKGGFDTGATFARIYKTSKSQSQKHHLQSASQISQSLYENAVKNKQMPSVGIGSAHRAAVLSMFPWLTTPFDKTLMAEEKNEEQQQQNAAIIANATLQQVVEQESCLTHYAPLSRQCSVAVNFLCRALIVGHSWKDALKLCHKYIEDSTVREILTIFISNKQKLNTTQLEMGGYAPDVLKAALFFVHEYNSFEASLTASIEYAGAANFCPVLVGSMAGAKYGMKAVLHSTQFRHRLNMKLIASDAVSACVDTTDCKLMKISDFEIQLAKQVSALWAK